MKKNITLIILVLIVFASCKKDDLEGKVKMSYISEYTINSNRIYEIYYTDTKITKIDYYTSGGELINKMTVDYSDDLLESISYFDNSDSLVGYKTFEYDSLNISEIIYFEPTISGSLEKKSYDEFYYRDDKVNKLKHYQKYYNDFDLIYTEEFTYNSIGNITFAETNNDIEYEYDDKKNPFFNLYFIFGHIAFSNNNITKALYTSNSGNILSNSYNASFSYNSEDFPTEEIRTGITNTDEIIINWWRKKKVTL